MIVTIQHPLADSRRFLADNGRLPFPSWPIPSSDKEFIRSSGIVRNRRHGVDAFCSADEAYCSAKAAVKFRPLFDRKGSGFSLTSPFRRFLSDGNVLSRVGVGFRTVIKPLPALNSGECIRLINQCARTDVKIGSTSDFCALVGAGPRLAAHYLNSTTRLISGIPAATERWWLQPGKPLILLQYSLGEIVEHPKAIAVDAAHRWFRVGLRYMTVNFLGESVPVWFLCDDQNHHEYSRHLRLYLLRIHAERECLKGVLRLMISGRLSFKANSEYCQRLQAYLRKALNTMVRLRAYGILGTRSAFSIMNDIEDFIAPGERETLLRTLKEMNTRRDIVKSW